MLSEFVEFAGKKEYECPKCKAKIRYAKFFGSDKKILTTDGKEPNKIFGRGSNTGWPTDPITKQMHECPPKDVPESELKRTDTLHTGDNRETTAVDVLLNTLVAIAPPNQQPELSEIDKKVRDRIIQESYNSAMILIFKLRGVEKACKELGIELGAKSGMIFNQVCAEDRSLKERGD